MSHIKENTEAEDLMMKSTLEIDDLYLNKYNKLKGYFCNLIHDMCTHLGLEQLSGLELER